MGMFLPALESQAVRDAIKSKTGMSPGDPDGYSEWLMGASIPATHRNFPWTRVGRRAIAETAGLGAPSAAELRAFWAARNYMSTFGVGRVSHRGQVPGDFVPPSRADIETGALERQLAREYGTSGGLGDDIRLFSDSGKSTHGLSGVRASTVAQEVASGSPDGEVRAAVGIASAPEASIAVSESHGRSFAIPAFVVVGLVAAAALVWVVMRRG